jgi:hypothetical protein
MSARLITNPALFKIGDHQDCGSNGIASLLYESLVACRGKFRNILVLLGFPWVTSRPMTPDRWVVRR